jgi:hypothetical protein
MAKLKGDYVKTESMIYDLSGPMGSMFKIGVEDKQTHLISLTSGVKLWEVVETYQTFEDMVKMNRDILEIKEPNTPVRYAVVRAVIGDKVDTTEGLVDPFYITAILDYNEWTDSYVRFKIM